MAFFVHRKGSNNNQESDGKKPFLEPSVHTIYLPVAGKLKNLSKLPTRTDNREWMATNSLAFFNHINVQVGAISALCTAQTCPTMTAGKETFEWLDEKKASKKSAKVPAKQFIDASLTQIQKQLRDERIFPTKFGYEFPPDFMTIVKKTFRTFFAILAHIYYHHFITIKNLNLHDGLNSLFLHFMYFVQEFKLLDSKEWACMEELLKVLTQVDKDLAKNPPIDEFGDMSMHMYSRVQLGGGDEGQSLKGSASNPS